MFSIKIKTQTIELVQRNTKIYACIHCVGIITSNVNLPRLTLTITQVITLTYAVGGEIRIVKTKLITGQLITVIER